MTQQFPAQARVSSKALAWVEVAALAYGVIAVLAAGFMVFLAISATAGSGYPAISLPVAANDATQVPALASDPSTMDAHFTGVEFTAKGLSPGATMLYYGGRFLTPLTHAVVAFSIVATARAGRTGRPFGPSLSRAASCSAIAVAGLGSISQLTFLYGSSLARSELLATTSLYEGWLQAAVFDWTPALVGVALAMVAAIFRHGERLQRDTDGLV